MNEQSAKYLKLARAARSEDNSEDAKRYYDMLRTEEPENAEAKFFYQLYSLLEGKNGEIPTRFSNLCNVVSSSIKQVAESADSASEKLEQVEVIVECFTPRTMSLNKYMTNLTVGSGGNQQRVFSAADINNVRAMGINALYKAGDTVEQVFGSDPDYMKYAVIAWKEAVALNQKYYGVVSDKTKPETYANKIKKIESSYTLPKKAGCISFG